MSLKRDHVHSPEITVDDGGNLNSDLVERFRQQNGAPRPTHTDGQHFHPSKVLAPYAKRLREYDAPIAIKDNSEEWISTPELPLCDELIGNSIDRLDETNFNVIDGPWASNAQYLESHYKLLRENALRPLRQAVSSVMKNPQEMEPSGGSIGIYDDVKITRITFATRGIGIRVSFSLRRVGKQVKWNQSKRLSTGSIVVLIPANKISTDSVKVAVVASRALSLVDTATPEVDIFFAQSDELEIDTQKKWVMVEDRAGFFEAERHTLLALQKMMRESFPLSEQIVKLQATEKPPDYVLQSPITDLSSIFPTNTKTSSAVNILANWPTQELHEMKMDKSQLTALERMLTQPLALVQGPPGTGKTFVSTQTIDVMLANMKETDPPIVIASQTNHALDQILRHIEAIRPESFIRLGSRSKDQEVVQKRTLFALRDSFKIPYSGRRRSGRRRIQDLTKRMKELLRPFQKGAGALTLEYLQQNGILTEAQSSSIRASASKWQSAGLVAGDNNDLQKWVGLELKPFVEQPTRYIFPEIEEPELDLEDPNELEAENLASSNDEEFELLVGDHMELGDDWVGTGGGSATQAASGRISDNVAKLIQRMPDMNKITPKLRGAVYNHLVSYAKDLAVTKFRQAAIEYSAAVRECQIGKWEEDAAKIDQFKIIGVTTTGFSKYRALISAVRPRVILIEEAAEVLEAPVIATCIDSLQHLILVGDHQQLRPRCQVRELEGDPVNLNFSMFERLVSNGLDFSLLTRQRRMIPGIRRLLQPIYGDSIEDHHLVKDKANRPPIPGMGKKSAWFYNHYGPEAKDDQLSFYNPTEAAMIVEFIRYLLYNRVPAEQITVLTFYNGQKRRIKTFLRQRIGEPGSLVQIVTVDSYQGEENGIILLSLVRNNCRGNIGFLAIENRVCVALSRAQRGMYIFGNGELLCGESRVWSEVINILFRLNANDRRRIGFTLPLQCEKHKRKTWIETLQDWEENAGGCEIRCQEVMDCGHTCVQLCHNSTQHDCKKTCGKLLPCSHFCTETCVAICRCRECGNKPRSTNARFDQPKTGSGRTFGGDISLSYRNKPWSVNSSEQSQSSRAWVDFANGDANGDAIQHDEDIRLVAEGNVSREYLRHFDEINHGMLFDPNFTRETSTNEENCEHIKADGRIFRRLDNQNQVIDDIKNWTGVDHQPSLLD